ncbi:MAG: hypothetical protein KBD52_00105 [Candidatus Pacebacteria bacterium]|nr:hypothetical protein [Candidatus Paceibacterota bacterium]
MKILNKKNKKNGYTIIETMISVSLFLILVITGIGSLLNANVVHNKSRNVRAIMDNLSFIMEDMSRNLRTGYNYRCYDTNNPWDGSEIGNSSIEVPRSCENGHAIAFEEAINGVAGNLNDQWVYKISDNPLTIQKSTNSGATWVPLHNSEIIVNNSPSFSVLGAEPPLDPTGGDKQQPLVMIRLSGNIIYKDLNSPFSLQTMVSQRLIDIVSP